MIATPQLPHTPIPYTRTSGCLAWYGVQTQKRIKCCCKKLEMSDCLVHGVRALPDSLPFFTPLWTLEVFGFSLGFSDGKPL